MERQRHKKMAIKMESLEMKKKKKSVTLDEMEESSSEKTRVSWQH